MLLYTNFRNKRKSKNNSQLKYSAFWNAIWTNRNEWKRIETNRVRATCHRLSFKSSHEKHQVNTRRQNNRDMFDRRITQDVLVSSCQLLVKFDLHKGK